MAALEEAYSNRSQAQPRVEQTARSLSVAESEGMGGGEENKLGRVELAIALVEKQP